MSEITLNSLPKTLDELKAMPQVALTVPEEVAARQWRRWRCTRKTLLRPRKCWISCAARAP